MYEGKKTYIQRFSVTIAKGNHLYPSRTQKLSLSAPMVLSWTRLGRVGRRRIFHSSIAQSVEHAAVNRRVVGSSPTGGAKNKKSTFCITLQDADFFYIL